MVRDASTTPLRPFRFAGSRPHSFHQRHRSRRLAHQPFLPTRKLKWLTELETKLSRDVSLVVVTPELNPVLGFEIIHDGRLVYEEKEGMWADERARLWHLYNDSLPFRRALRRQLREFALEVHRGA